MRQFFREAQLNDEQMQEALGNRSPDDREGQRCSQEERQPSPSGSQSAKGGSQSAKSGSQSAKSGRQTAESGNQSAKGQSVKGDSQSANGDSWLSKGGSVLPKTKTSEGSLAKDSHVSHAAKTKEQDSEGMCLRCLNS